MAGTGTDTVPRQRRYPDGAPGGAHGVGGRDPGGRTVIEHDVVEKAAAQAVREVPGALLARSRGTRARISGEIILLRLRVGVHYPHSAREVAARVRGHVRQRVERITGKRIRHIDIEIAELVR
ncbi:Asp23/Gls24 family envelope stress response protein [Nocardiopsis quinghaiensis]|uniref:Asp23/Gls24 family envelope stress response protein n=1 Tax=Nocardiopsis quinghaiensis TaxID=464995 RepID=UPI00123AB402|nr:Asp23/Gls24 family envelope stress response protein [Nocardiopsis quinghaiensis]